MAGVFGMGLLWLIFLNIFFGIFVAIVFFGVRTRQMGLRLNAHTFTEIVARGTAIFFGLCACAFLPMYVGALWSRAITKAGALAGMLTGTLSSLLWMPFIKHGKVIWAFVDPLIIGLPLAALVPVAVSALTRKLPKEHLDLCFGKPAEAPAP